MSDPFDLQRFVDAQEGVIDDVRAELTAGRKRSHWIWFVFPQIAGLGHSEMAQRYAIQSRTEAEAYLAHPLLGGRLVELTSIVNGWRDRSAHEIFGSPDDIKFHSSMTLFALSAADPAVFDEAAASLLRQPSGRSDRCAHALSVPCWHGRCALLRVQLSRSQTP
ncbi:NTP pyrophosphohydrolase including oxidative damage repair enzyme [Candidatus Burkholderia pumila]|uniref:NTP pyrophosphohydrolase including oxidative damage repair enzyme n=1 Tax=Candidatus Burkholderia pumila TaxID=1090375 RepID=A0ABR5HN05_9BURK|nr:NTP pyrophosphohydrolase including oxidative damage repair enzyme [Candidatus Burkholderia pumila]